MALVEYSLNNKCVYIKINRPEKKNALNYDTVMELKKAFTKAETESKAKIIVLTGEGDYFCAGADLEYLSKLQKYSYDENLNDSIHLMQLFKLVYHLKKPVLSMIKGGALAGGCGLVAVSDFAFATEDSKFGFTEVRIGFLPAIVSVFLIRKIGEAKTKELLISGEIFDSKKALELGLITSVFPVDELEKQTETFIDKLLQHNSSNSMNATKQLINKITCLSFEDALKYAAEANAKNRLSEDCKKGIAAFLEKKDLIWN